MTKETEGSESGSLTADRLLEKLRRSLQQGGDFPASAKVVNELQLLTSNPKTTANQITEVILREPSLGTRVLSLVNSSFYQRAKPIMTVSQAVIQIGMRPLAELCAGLVLLQKFVPAARRGGPFADCLQKTILTSLLTSSLSDHHRGTPSSAEEQGYLAGTFAELGTLLLAYYFPKLYESAVRRAESKGVPTAQGLLELTGLTTLRLSLEVIDALQLPGFYREVLQAAADLTQPSPAEAPPPAPTNAQSRISRSLFAAQEISTAVLSCQSKAALDKTLLQIQGKVPQLQDQLNQSLGELPQLFKDHCASMDLDLPKLPEYVSTYAAADAPADQPTPAETPKAAVGGKFNQFVEEIREAVEHREPTASIITSVMEALAWSLSFDRVLLMLVDANRRALVGRMFLGNLENFNPRDVSRPVDDNAHRYAPDATAFKEARPVFSGDPILADGWPITAIPIGFGQRAIGVIYAERQNPDGEELSAGEQAAIGLLAELLDRSISFQSS